MSFRLRLSILGLSVVIAVYVVVGGLLPRYGVVVGSSDPYSQFQIFQEVLSRVVNDYVDEPDLERVRVGALKGLAEGLDPQSAYLTPDQVRRMEQRRAGSLERGASGAGFPMLGSEGETGMVLTKVAGYAYVVSVIASAPAEAAGVRPGDVIEYIGTRATRDMSLFEAEEQLIGPVGREVELKVFTRGSSSLVRVRLDRVMRPAPEARVMAEAKGIGYLKLGTLDEGAAQGVEAALEGLMRQGVDRVILDLRRVAWGRLQEAVRVAQLFIGSGVLARTIGRDGRVIETYSAEPGRQRFGGRLAVVIDRSTMGAAEVIAAAVVEHRRGEVVGERTFGGGGEQQLFRLRDGGGLWLTTVKYAGPSGVAIMGSQGRGAGGVAPTVEVARAELGLRPEELEQEREVGERAREREGEGARERAGEGGKEDVVLRRAIELLQAPVSPGRR